MGRIGCILRSSSDRFYWETPHNYVCNTFLPHCLEAVTLLAWIYYVLRNTMQTSVMQLDSSQKLDIIVDPRSYRHTEFNVPRNILYFWEQYFLKHTQ